MYPPIVIQSKQVLRKHVSHWRDGLIFILFSLMFQSFSSSQVSVSSLAAQALKNVEKLPENELQKAIIRRKEWTALTLAERKEYTDAVQCLQSKPPLTPAHEVPGVKSRFDDFVATHINQTYHIHGTGNFLAWHRFFIFTYEEALRNECGFSGYLPVFRKPLFPLGDRLFHSTDCPYPDKMQYWNWARTSSDILNAPEFDGSPYSMGSNGRRRDHKSITISGPGRAPIIIPAGSGGGCLISGPFANMSVNMGPIAPAYPIVPLAPSPFAYNPRCLTRDLSTFVASQFQKESLIVDLITQSPDIATFQNNLQGDPPRGIMGLHAAGHLVIGGDPAVDLLVSPGEPMFYLHHAMVDRVWWIWQQLDAAHRTFVIAGTRTMENSPPSSKATLEDFIDLGYNARPVQLKNLMSTMKGPFNYVYV